MKELLNKILWMFFFFLFSCSLIRGQKNLGKKYFMAGRYHDALEAWSGVRNLERDFNILLLRGIAHYQTQKPLLCIRDMSEVYKKKPWKTISLKFAALSYMSLYDYEEASRFFKAYLNDLKPGDRDYIWTIHQIRRCGQARNFKYKEPVAFVENLKEPVNSIYDEVKPIMSPTQSGRIYFSSNREGSSGGLRNEKGLEDPIHGRYHFDMYQSALNKGQYQKPQIFLPLLNGPRHEILQAISQDGQTVYYVKSDNPEKGALLSDTFSLNQVQSYQSSMADVPLNIEKGDRDLFWVNDSLIIFSSRRYEGLGGYDLFYCQNTGGEWQTPINLGSPINTPHNEISPFLVNSGDILYFSSDKIETLGGFDIFKSHFIEEAWVEPVSLNYPVNSANDDIDFVISEDGTYGLFSSNRVSFVSGYDLYVSFFNEPVYGQLERVHQPEFILIQKQDDKEEYIDNTTSENNVPDIERFYMSKTLFFDGNDMTLNPKNHKILNTLADFMLIYPELEVLFISHTYPKVNNYTDMFFSAKRAEMIAEEWIAKHKLSENRVHIIGCGSDYPFYERKGLPENNYNMDNNNRTELVLISHSYPGLHVSYDFDQVTEKQKNWERLHDGLKGLLFKIEIGESYFPMNYNVIVDNASYVTVGKNGDGPFLYYYGMYKDIETARNSPIEGQIVPFYKGKKIGKENVHLWLKQFPELNGMYD